MSVHSIAIISESGGLQFYYDHSIPTIEVEKTFSYPLHLSFKYIDRNLVLDFGGKDNLKIGHVVMAVNGVPVKDRKLVDGTEITEIFKDPSKFPLSIKFGRPKLTTNEKIVLSSMFHSLHRMSRTLSPAGDSSGIQTLETNDFKMHCLEAMSGVKFLLITDNKVSNAARDLLKKIYEYYCDYVLKNPFYAHNQPIQFDLFKNYVKSVCEQIEKLIN